MYDSDSDDEDDNDDDVPPLLDRDSHMYDSDSDDQSSDSDDNETNDQPEEPSTYTMSTRSGQVLRTPSAAGKGKKIPIKRKVSRRTANRKNKKPRRSPRTAAPASRDTAMSDTESDEEEEDDALAPGSNTVDGAGRGNSNHDDNAINFDVSVIEEVAADDATAISVAFPVDGQRFGGVTAYESLPQLLADPDARDKVKFVATLCKTKSKSLYSFSQLTTAPHQTHPASEAIAVHGAAAEFELPNLRLNGDMSIVHADTTFLAPGTEEYRALELEDSIAATITPDVLSSILEGFYKYGMGMEMNKQKAGEHVGESRGAFNFGVGYAGHGYRAGREAPAGELAELSLMNLDNVARYFPDSGRCLGVVFEALGKAQEAILQYLDREERPNEARNTKYAGEVGRRLHKPGCEAGECLFFSLECSRSAVMGRVMDRLNSYLERRADGDRVHLHVDGQNPSPGSEYSRVVLATWTLYFNNEGDQCPMQLTAILCNRNSICQRNINNEVVDAMREVYQRGVARFAHEHGDLRYEQDGLGLFSRARELIVTYLENELPDSGNEPGCWVGHMEEAEETDEVDGGAGTLVGTGRYRLVQGAKGNRHLATVGDQTIKCNRRNLVNKGTSDVDYITDPATSPILHARMRTIRANPNKMAPFCAIRHAAKLVADKFTLREPHVWDLFYCHLQHYICPAQFLAKCLSLVEQWEELWAPPCDFGVAWLEACGGRGFNGKVAHLFMNLSVPAHGNCVTSKLKCVAASHVDKELDYTAEFCKEQVELLRQFGDELEGSNDSRTTIDILNQAKSKTGKGTLGKVANVGEFGLPQVHTNLFLWGLVDIPCWRAAECPIMDKGKKHYTQAGNAADAANEDEDNDLPDPAGQADLFQTVATTRNVKNLLMVHRGMLIIAHEDGTCEIRVENGGCKGVRPTEVQDQLLIGMDSLDFRPTDTSNAYCPDYNLWLKLYGPNERWEIVPQRNIKETLRIAH